MCICSTILNNTYILALFCYFRVDVEAAKSISRFSIRYSIVPHRKQRMRPPIFFHRPARVSPRSVTKLPAVGRVLRRRGITQISQQLQQRQAYPQHNQERQPPRRLRIASRKWRSIVAILRLRIRMRISIQIPLYVCWKVFWSLSPFG